jgi:hypothetical protein
MIDARLSVAGVRPALASLDRKSQFVETRTPGVPHEKSSLEATQFPDSP